MSRSEQVMADSEQTLAHSVCWESVDAVVCINLDKRVDRWEAFCRSVQGLVPQEKIHRISAVCGVELPGYGQKPWFTDRTGVRSSYWAGVAGCTLSHMRAVRLAQERGWGNVLILEDDVSPSLTEEGLAMMQRALGTLTGRYMLYLGYTQVKKGERCMSSEQASLWRLGGALAAHAYIVPQSMYQPLLEALPKSAEDVWEWISFHRAVDTFYLDEVPGWSGVSIYAVLPLMFYQNGMSSDLVQGSVNTVIPICEEPVALSRMGKIWSTMMSPFCKMKQRLNSWRTHRRAIKGGFPGFRKKRIK